MNIDLKIAKYIIRILNYYINIRKNYRQANEEKRWKRLFRKDTKFVGKLNDSLMIFHFQDSILSRYIYSGFEETYIIFTRNYLKRSDIYIDIGSNIGLFSLHAAQIVGESGKVYAFEPTPDTYERLRQNIDLNKFNDKVITNNLGLSSEKGILTMNITIDGYDAWNTFASSTDVPFQKQLLIPVDTLDNYLKSHNINHDDIALIKIDVEGWEVAVIKGAIETLNQLNSPALMVEFTETNLLAAGTNCYELYDIVTSLGYRWYTYDSNNNCLIPEPKKLHYPYNNLIAIKSIEEAQHRLSN